MAWRDRTQPVAGSQVDEGHCRVQLTHTRFAALAGAVPRSAASRSAGVTSAGKVTGTRWCLPRLRTRTFGAATGTLTLDLAMASATVPNTTIASNPGSAASCTGGGPGVVSATGFVDVCVTCSGRSAAIAELPWIDTLVCAVGTGGHSAGIHRMLRQSFAGVRLVGVDAVGSTIFGQPARARLMRGLGSSIHPRNVDYAAFSEVHWVGPAEAVATCRRLAASSYHAGGWSTGAVALVADWLARTQPAERTTVAVFPDGPWRYWDTVYDDDYCHEHGLLGQVPAGEPDEISHPWQREVTRWTRCRRVADPTTQGRSK